MAGRTERRAGSSSRRGKPHSEKRKKPTGGAPSLRQETVAEREDRQPRSSGPRPDERTFNLIVDDVPYMVKASPFRFNDELRFHVSINGGQEHVFTWDSDLKALRAIDDEASVLPDSLEEAISQRLQSKER